MYNVAGLQVHAPLVFLSNLFLLFGGEVVLNVEGLSNFLQVSFP